MKIITALLLTVYVMCSFPFTVLAEDPALTKEPSPLVHGEAACLIDVQSGQTLYAKNPDEQLPPASTTKIMTGLLAIENGNFKDVVTASSTMLNDKVVYGTQIYLEPGEKMTFEDLLYAMLLNSANDAAVDIAEHVGGSLPHFVDMMNQRALQIGATRTHFLNPTGLTETGHVTTAHDLAIIAREAYQNPVFAQFVRTKTHTIARSKAGVPSLMVNENKLLGIDPDVDGIKTGYTAAAQNCLVASITKDGRQMIGVILKSPGHEIYTDMQSLFDYGSAQFKNSIVKPTGAVISTITVNNEPVNLILDRPIYMTQKVNEQSPILSLRIPQASSNNLNSVEKGQIVAHVEVLVGNSVVETIPLISARSISPLTQQKNPSLLYQPWVSGAILMGVVLSLLLSQKIYSESRWRKRLRSTKGSETNS